MKILFDHQIFSFQDFGGISRYVCELNIEINKTKHRAEIEGKFSNNIYLKQSKKKTIGVLPGTHFPYKNILIFYLNNLLGEKKVQKLDYDILHATYYHPYFRKLIKNKPYVITVYDMIHEIFQRDYKNLRNKTTKYKKELIMKADQIIAISENTKKDLMKLYKVPSSKITVIYLGCSLGEEKPSKIIELPKNYLLFVGTRLGYKNFQFFVRSIADILKSHNDVYLVCAGGGEFSPQEITLFNEIGIINKIRHVRFKTDGELVYLYQKAIAHVIPSLYEGFGMTVLEAFAMSCPVISSKISSLPEVCGDAAYYINPKDAGSIQKSVITLLNNPKLREELVKKGKKQLKKFSWKKTAKETLRVYEKALAQ